MPFRRLSGLGTQRSTGPVKVLSRDIGGLWGVGIGGLGLRD